MYLNVSGTKYKIIILKKDNKNTYIRVKEDLNIYISTNKRNSDRQIEKIIEKNYEDIVKMINSAKKKNKESEKNLFLGNEIDIVVVSTQKKPEIYNNKLYIKDKSKIDIYYKNIAYDIYKERLDYIYNLFNEYIPYPQLKVRRMTSRWGVCNRKNKSITINTELVKKDLKYIDYVIIHELCHFVHFNHSSDFWKLVSKYCDNYKKLRKEMKE
jgi:hypothetical protein